MSIVAGRVAGRMAGDTVYLLQQGIRPLRDKAGDKGENRLLSGIKEEKKKCKVDLVDKKWDDVARWKVVFVRGVCKSKMRRSCHEPGDEPHQAKKLSGLDMLCEGRTIIKHG